MASANTQNGAPNPPRCASARSRTCRFDWPCAASSRLLVDAGPDRESGPKSSYLFIDTRLVGACGVHAREARLPATRFVVPLAPCWVGCHVQPGIRLCVSHHGVPSVPVASAVMRRTAQRVRAGTGVVRQEGTHSRVPVLAVCRYRHPWHLAITSSKSLASGFIRLFLREWRLCWWNRLAGRSAARAGSPRGTRSGGRWR